MANSGSYATNSIVSSRTLTFAWSLQSQNIANNTSTVYWELKGSGGTTTTWVKGQKFRQTVDGQTWSSDTNISVYNGTLIMSGTKTIGHNTDGSKSFGANTVAQMYNYTDNTWGSGSWALPTIPRQANITGADNFNDEGDPNITYSNPAGNSVSSLQACISLTGTTDDIKYRDISKTGSSYKFALTTAERELLRSETPNSNTLSVIFYVRTVIGGATYHSTLTRTMTIVNATPTVSSVKYADTNEVTKALTGNDQAIVSGYSNLRVNDIVMSSFKYATLKHILVEDVSEAYSETYTKTINKYSKNSVGVKAVDSRGNTSTALTKVFDAYIPYAGIAKGNSVAVRGGQGVGEDTTITCEGNWFNGDFGAVNNSLSATYEWKKTTDSEWTPGQTVLSIATNENTFKIDQLIKGDLDTGFDVSHAYDIRVSVGDALTSVVFTMTLMAGAPAIAILGNRIALGGKLDENTSAKDIQFKKSISVDGAIDVDSSRELKKYRYVRAYSNGSSADTGNHYCDIQAFMCGSKENLCLGKEVTASSAVDSGGVAVIVDGIVTTSPYANLAVGLQWVEVDLGDEYALDRVKVWRYYSDRRKYNNTKITVFDADRNEEVVLQDSSSTGVYEETAGGYTAYTPNHKAVLSIDNGISINDALLDLETEDWIEPSLSSGWLRYSNEYNAVGFRKDRGIVRLKGLIRGGTIVNDATGSAPVFVLPAGYRPITRLLMSTKSSATTPARVDVFPNGVVQVVEGANYFVGLDGITFIAEQ